MSKDEKIIARILQSKHDEDDKIEEFGEELGIVYDEDEMPDEEEIQDVSDDLEEEMGLEDAEEEADEKMGLWRGIHHELNKRKSAKNNKKVNEYAVCTKTAGRDNEKNYVKWKKDIIKEKGGSGANIKNKKASKSLISNELLKIANILMKVIK